MVRPINYFWVLPTTSIQSKGSDSLQSAGSSPGFSVRWSSTSMILTLMAWRSNILQKSFVRDCSSLLKNDLHFTCRWQSLQLAVACCAFCALFLCYQKCLNFVVLKVLPSGCVSLTFSRVYHAKEVDPEVRLRFIRLICLLGFVRLWCLLWSCNAECSEVRLVRWWTCSGSNCLCLRFVIAGGCC